MTSFNGSGTYGIGVSLVKPRHCESASLHKQGNVPAVGARRGHQHDPLRCAKYVGDKVIASDEIRKRIIEIGIRKLARETGLHSDTVTLIARGNSIKPNTLNKVIEALSG
jgi:hypothetical protein